MLVLAGWWSHDVFSHTVAMSIKQLPSDVVAQIKSSIAITSLNSVVLGLVKNSLDARSSKINISVDYRKGNCSVEDNGLGIAPAEFLVDGALGKLHCKDDLYLKAGVFLTCNRHLEISS